MRVVVYIWVLIWIYNIYLYTYIYIFVHVSLERYVYCMSLWIYMSEHLPNHSLPEICNALVLLALSSKVMTTETWEVIGGAISGGLLVRHGKALGPDRWRVKRWDCEVNMAWNFPEIKWWSSLWAFWDFQGSGLRWYRFGDAMWLRCVFSDWDHLRFHSAKQTCPTPTLFDLVGFTLSYKSSRFVDLLHLVFSFQNKCVTSCCHVRHVHFCWTGSQRESQRLRTGTARGSTAGHRQTPSLMIFRPLVTCCRLIQLDVTELRVVFWGCNNAWKKGLFQTTFGAITVEGRIVCAYFWAKHGVTIVRSLEEPLPNVGLLKVGE